MLAKLLVKVSPFLIDNYKIYKYSINMTCGRHKYDKSDDRSDDPSKEIHQNAKCSHAHPFILAASSLNPL